MGGQFFTILFPPGFIWFLFARGMQNPSHEMGMTLYFTSMTASNMQELSVALGAVKGVEEVVLVVQDQVAYLKVVKAELDQQQLDKLMASYE